MRSLLAYLLLFFAIAAVLRVDFYFNVLYLLAGVYFMSRWWTRRTLERTRVERRFVPRAFLGEAVTVDLTVRNADWLPVPWLELRESLPVALSTPPFFREVVSMHGRETRRLRYTLYARRRGYYPIGPMVLRTGDLLGVVGGQQDEVAPDALIVYPKVVPLQQLGLPTRSPLVALPARAPLFEDASRVRGVRDYQRGDSPRRIHWTATASTGRLVVKQYQPAIARETLICLDLDEEHYERGSRFTATELAIVIAASVASHVVRREGLPVGLATQAHDPLDDAPRTFVLPPHRERSHLMHVLEVLARVQATTGTDFTDFLRRQGVDLSWGATLVVVTGRATEPLFETLLYLRRLGLAVALVLVEANQPAPMLRQQSAVLHVPIYRVWDERDVEAWEPL